MQATAVRRQAPAASAPRDSSQRLITARDLAERLSISLPYLWALARSGRVPAVRVGRQFRFDAEVVFQHLHGTAPQPALCKEKRAS